MVHGFCRIGFSRSLIGITNSFGELTTLGVGTKFSPVSKNENTFIGYQAGFSNTVNGNTFIGYQTGFNNTTASGNVFVGSQAGYNNTSGIQNTFLGYQAGFNNTIGDSNTFIGSQAGYSNISGVHNTFIGYQAGYNNNLGNSNTFIGYQAGYSTITGSGNTYIGLGAGYGNQSGCGNICIGTFAGSNESGSNKLYIANTSTTIPLIAGDFSTQTVGINVPANPAPNSTLTVGGSLSVPVIRFSGAGGAGSNVLSNTQYLIKNITPANVTNTLPRPFLCSGRIYELIQMSTSGTGLIVAGEGGTSINGTNPNIRGQFYNLKVISDGSGYWGMLMPPL